MPRKKPFISPADPDDKAFSLGSAPMSEEMHNIINSMKNCKATGDEAGEILGKAIERLLLASLEQLAKQREMPQQDTQHT